MTAVLASQWAGALIAGGQSRRMGQDKLLRRLPDGRRLLEAPAQALRENCAHLLLVEPERQEQHQLDGFLPVADAKKDCGPLAGLVAALEWAQEHDQIHWVLALAGDLPLIRPNMVAALQLAALQNPEQATVALGTKGPQPLVAAYPAHFATSARLQLEQGHHALRDLLEKQAWVPWDGLQAFGTSTLPPDFNLNRPTDWERFLAESDSSSSP